MKQDVDPSPPDNIDVDVPPPPENIYPRRPKDDQDNSELGSPGRSLLSHLESYKRRRTGSDLRELRSNPSGPPSLADVSTTILSAPSPAWSVRSEPEVPDWWSRDNLEDENEKHAAISLALESIQAYLQEYSEKVEEMDPFWSRKSGKTVLSVVVCRNPDAPPGNQLVVHRGMNTEVSLAAGSLCAERSAISRAATDFHSASDILSIATIDPEDKINPLWPCEVCQSWLAKLRPQSPEIAVIAVTSRSCETFAVRVNGEYQLAPRPLMPPPRVMHSDSDIHWPDLIVLAEGTMEMPWEARELVYIDGAWNFMHSAHLNILKQARSRGTHLLVGVHSEEVLRSETDSPLIEAFDQRLGRILENRHVSSVLKDAPWCLTSDMINSFGIKRVVCGSFGGKVGNPQDPYRVAKESGILETVTSINETRGRNVHETLLSPAMRPQSPSLGPSSGPGEPEALVL